MEIQQEKEGLPNLERTESVSSALTLTSPSGHAEDSGKRRSTHKKHFKGQTAAEKVSSREVLF